MLFSANFEEKKKRERISFHIYLIKKIEREREEQTCNDRSV